MKMLLPPYLKKCAVGLMAISLFAMSGISEAASVLYEQSVSSGDGVAADVATPSLVADNFSIGHSSLESVVWWGAYFDDTNVTDNFVIKIYSDLAGTGTELNSGIFGRALVNGYYEYQFDLTTPLDLSAGNYFLSIQNQDDSWAWLFGNPGNSSFWNLPVGASNWSLALDQNDSVILSDLAFRLEGNAIQNVPEPESTMLVLLGLGMLMILSIKLGRDSKSLS